ncbi:GntR family transcriptional regulator [Ottowia thiooxydans]|uniref:GntR family transcriptional regulator n=1 Tax=Ottowia thiooxydans TaxID=219182 RepID=UPI0003F596D3|nr:FCD domain-containing protein [Ottowia thiooxydans]
MENGPTPTLARMTYDRLRSDVLNGYWVPGRKLLMHELRERYDVGASPLREALNRLASEAWVVHSDQRGFTVVEASQERLDDLVRTRIAIESLAISQSIENKAQAWEETLVLAFHRLSRASRSISTDSYEENPEWERLHRNFHRALLAGCESRLMLDFCDQLYDQAYWYRQLTARVSYKERDVLEEHRALFEAVINGRADEAKRLVGEHYQRTAGIFREAY